MQTVMHSNLAVLLVAALLPHPASAWLFSPSPRLRPRPVAPPPPPSGQLCRTAENSRVYTTAAVTGSGPCQTLLRLTTAPTQGQQCACFRSLSASAFPACKLKNDGRTWRAVHLACLHYLPPPGANAARCRQFCGPGKFCSTACKAWVCPNCAAGPGAPPPPPRPANAVLVNVVGGTPPSCGQVTVSLTYVPNAVAFAKKQGWVGSRGSCACKGFAVTGGTKALPASLTGHPGHPLIATLFTKIGRPAGPKLVVANVVGGGKCGQFTILSTYLANAVAFAKAKGWKASAGSCAAKGFGKKGDKTTLPAATTGYTSTPVVVTLYSYPSGPVMASVIGGTPPVCGQFLIDSKYVPAAVAKVAVLGKGKWVAAAGPCAARG